MNPQQAKVMPIIWVAVFPATLIVFGGIVFGLAKLVNDYWMRSR